AEVAALPAPPGRSQTAAVAAPTVVDAGSGPVAPLAERALADARALAPVAPPMAAVVTETAPRNGVPSIAAAAVPPAALAGAIVAPAPSRGRIVTMTAAAPAPPPVEMAAAAQPASLAPSPPARVMTAAASRPTTRVVPPPKPTLAAPARAARPSFWVQVGAFRTFEAASRVAERLRDQPIAFDVSAPREALLRVLVGPFADHARAATALRGLKARGFQPFIQRD
ncbi:MAG: SPOR domain-containing protein, partial [Candidatus Rokuibacteriota bacterium]